MELTYRAAVLEDFAAFYHNCFYRERDNRGVKLAAAEEWDVLLRNPATISMVVEDGARPAASRAGGVRSIGVCHGGVCAVGEVCARTQSVSASRAALPDGSWPLLTLEEVGRGNAGAGLNGLFHALAPGGLDVVGHRDAGRGKFQHDAFQTMIDGYRFQELLIEAIGEAARDQALWAGFLQRNDYADYYRGGSVPPEKRAFCWALPARRRRSEKER